MMQQKRRRREGFTLIELMIVIAIIGVLAAIAVPNFQAARRRANIRACYANQKTIAGAVEMYNLDFNQDITTLTGLGGASGKLKTEGYLQEWPNDPGQGSANNYSMTGTSGNGITCSKHGTIQAASS
jgi:type IV pilus assembly protein PilA